MTSLPMLESLTPVESTRLSRLERTIDKAVEVTGRIAGEALATIRDERLYRLTHSSFEAYVLDRWGFSRSTAYRMIDGATPRAVSPPPERESAGQRVPERDTSDDVEIGGLDVTAHVPASTSRCWAVVERVDLGRGLLRFEGEDEPGAGQRVLVAWTS